MPGQTKSGDSKGAAVALAASDGELVERGKPVDDAVVEAVYQDILNLQRDATIELAVKMGKLIVDKFYSGRLETWREHGNKEVSLRKLADRFEEGAEPGLSAAAIYRVVAIYELDHRLHVSARKHLIMTHVRAVIGLSPADQNKLLTEAEEKEWSTRELEEKVAKVRKKAADGRGRPPLPAFVKTTNLLGKLAAKDDAFGDLELLQGMEHGDVQEALDHVAALEGRLTALREKLEARLSD